MCIVQLVENEEADISAVRRYSCFQFLYPSIFTCHTWTWLRFIGMLSSFQTEGHGLAGQTAADELSVMSVHLSSKSYCNWVEVIAYCFVTKDLHFNFVLFCHFHLLSMLKIDFMNNKVEIVSIFSLICCIIFTIKGWYVSIFTYQKRFSLMYVPLSRN